MRKDEQKHKKVNLKIGLKRVVILLEPRGCILKKKKQTSDQSDNLEITQIKSQKKNSFQQKFIKKRKTVERNYMTKSKIIQKLLKDFLLNLTTKKI